MKKKKEGVSEQVKRRAQMRRQKRELGRVPDHRPSPSSGLCLALSLACVVIALSKLIFGPFEIREYTIVNDSPYSMEIITETIGDLSEKNYLTLDKEELSKAATDALPYVKSLEFECVFPFGMEIRVVPERIAYYCEREDGIYVFNENLKLIETRSLEESKSDLANVAKLKLPADMTVNEAGFPEFEFSFTAADVTLLAKDIEKTREGSDLTSIDFSDPYNIKIVLDEIYLVCFGGLDDRESKLKSVSEIFAECAPKMFEGRSLRIDVSVKALPTYTFDISIPK